MTELSTPEIAALQSQHVVVVLKHYAVYDQETDRQVLNETVSEKALNEIYLPHFKSAVQNAHVGGIFCAFASANGGPAVCSSADRRWVCCANGVSMVLYGPKRRLTRLSQRKPVPMRSRDQRSTRQSRASVWRSLFSRSDRVSPPRADVSAGRI